MIFLSFVSGDLFGLVLLPILIFIARVVDVSMGTLRTIFVVRGMKAVSAFIGFFEILIWLSAISQIMANLSNPINYLAYAGGFATGNYIGILIENKIAMGYQLIRAITTEKADDIISNLRKTGLRLTRTKAVTNGEKVDILYIPVKRRNLKNILREIKKYDPEATYTIQDIRALSKDTLPGKPVTKKIKIFGFIRKGK